MLPSGPARLSVGLVLLAVVTGCTLLGPGASPSEHPKASQAVTSTAQAQPRLRAQAQAVLDRRAHAIRVGDRAAFLADVDRSDGSFLAKQQRYFANLQRLPLKVFDYTVQGPVWNRLFASRKWRDEAYIPFVRLRMQLGGGFDRVPVRSVFGITFVPRDGRLMIVSDTDVGSRTGDGVGEQPWDLTRLTVRRTPHLLVLLDERSRAHGDAVVSSLEQALATVDRVVPFAWSHRVVVYAVGSPSVLRAMDHVPGGDVANLGAVSFPVYATPDGGRLVGTRFVVNPDVIGIPQPYLQRLVTHEMTHVAVARHGAGVPLWLTEGLAEYVSVRDLPASYVRVEGGVVKRASAGKVDGLPLSSKFNAVDQSWNYALAWFACDWIAAHRGEPALWDLLSAMNRHGRGTTDDQQGKVLRRVLGLGPGRLADLAAQRIAGTFSR